MKWFKSEFLHMSFGFVKMLEEEQSEAAIKIYVLHMKNFLMSARFQSHRAELKSESLHVC